MSPGPVTRLATGARRAVDEVAVRLDGRRQRDYPAPGVPFSRRYVRAQHDAVAAALEDAALLATFAAGAPLPMGYGRGFDERVVEYPWLFSRLRGRNVLDAGSVLNHTHVIDAALSGERTLTIFTAAPEALAFTDRGVSYVYGDLRDLPFRDDHFDTVVSLSTLEHVGMDNARYGNALAGRGDTEDDRLTAVRELCRVTQPGGHVLISVPFGIADDHGWLAPFDAAGIDALVAAVAPQRATVEVFAYGTDGWSRTTPKAAARARYRREDVPATPVWQPGHAPAAEAVACIDVEVTA